MGERGIRRLFSGAVPQPLGVGATAAIQPHTSAIISTCRDYKRQRRNISRWVWLIEPCSV